MPTTFDGITVKEQFQKEFNLDISNLTLGQLWTLVKFAKHIRTHCRNNNQFNDYMNRNFAPASFKEVDKLGRDGFAYRGLEIEVPYNFEMVRRRYTQDWVYGKFEEI